MTLSPGTRRGSYEILSPLGRGGMGEVYRARDLKLGRDVAIKTLPQEFARDPERMARFEREARLLASLNHPNIAAIYGVEEAEGLRLLVLECVEGETLAERLAAGPLPLEEALEVSAQIAAGLEAAHEAGVIHRDLKPGNVKIRPDGSVKVLDLGLARSLEPSVAAQDLSVSPTVTSPATRTGVILGTAAYMSPEQARGKPLDKRADIFSFGCVLYECLTGRQAFRGESVSDTLAAILKSEPDWSTLPSETPSRIRDLLRRCLQKDPRRRLHDIADARIEIEEALSAPAGTPAAAGSATQPTAAGRSQMLWALAGLLAGALAASALLWSLRPSVPRERPPSLRSALLLPPETRLRAAPFRPSMAFSPDGRKLVFCATRNGVTQLYLQALDRPDAEPIAGTEGAFNPFFSPDGQWLAFFTMRELKRISLSGGTPLTIAAVPPVTEGGTWALDGSILFPVAVNTGLYRVASSGGTPEPLTTPDTAAGEHGHVWPQILPGGKDVLLIVRAGKDFQDVANSNVAVHSLATGKRRVLIQGGTFARYVEPGYLLFVRGRTVLAAPCNPGRWELTGAPVPVLNDVLIAGNDATAFFAAAGNGLLAYAAGDVVRLAGDSVLWVDRSGREEAIPLPAQGYGFPGLPRLSPDGKRLALTVMESTGARVSIWIYDFARKVLSPLTPEPGRAFSPVWSPDGRRLAFTRYESGNPQLFWKAADGSGNLEPLSPGEIPEFPNSWSPDGRTLAFNAVQRDLRGLMMAGIENLDLWPLSLEGKRERRAWLASPFREAGAMFSPDGRSIAYTSDESGRNEVYVRPLAGPGKIKISSDGGSEPAWSPDGREIFYRTTDKLMAVPVQTAPELAAGEARPVLTERYARSVDDSPRNYDVSPDGNRFLFIKSGEVKEEPIRVLNLITNWYAELERAAAEKK